MALPRLFSSMFAWKVSIMSFMRGLSIMCTSSSACSVRLMKLVSKRFSGSMARVMPLSSAYRATCFQVLRAALQVALALVRGRLPRAAHRGVVGADHRNGFHRDGRVDEVLQVGTRRPSGWPRPRGPGPGPAPMTPQIEHCRPVRLNASAAFA